MDLESYMRNVANNWTILVLLVLSTAALGQTQGNTRKKPRSAPRVAPLPSNTGDNLQTDGTKLPASNFGTNLANSVTSAASDSDDHVPCFFTVKQLMDLRPVPSVAKLTEADQSRVLTSVVEAVDRASDAELTRDQKEKFIAILAGELDGKLVGKTPGEALATIMNILYQITSENVDLIVKSLSKQAQDEAHKNSGLWEEGTAEMRLRSLETILKPRFPDEAAKIHDAAAGQSTVLTGAVASSARTAINKFVRPDDIGCAYQILTWNQARLLFGRSVANEYIAVQITVRNLNPKEEFIVHNAMLSVDTDIHGAVGQYFEGADKIEVEAYNTAGESLTARGIVGNGIAAAGTLLSTLQPIVDADNFSHAVAAFNGGVVPGWAKISPDHQKDQLLLIANSGFSATYATKTVVGKSGAATFYTWFPAKPFLEGWWVQDCARRLLTMEVHTERIDRSQVGVDRKAAQAACQDSTAAIWKRKTYKEWSPTADQLFRDLSLAVVAGVHVLEEAKNKSAITDLKCPKNDRGELDFLQASPDGILSCDLTGDNLDKVAKLRLENAGNPVDPTRPEATVSVSGDSTTAKAAFKTSDLAAATGDVYNVLSVSKDGSESTTGQNIHLDQKTAVLTGVSPGSIDLNSPSTKLTITGYNLNNLTKVCFSNPKADSNGTFDVNNGSSKSQATVDVNSSKLSAGKWELHPNDCSHPAGVKVEMIVNGLPEPQVDSFSPSSAAPGKTVTIAGNHLSKVTSVTFGGVAAKPTIIDDTKLTVVVPPGAKSGSVGVFSAGKTTTKDGFKVLPQKGQPKPSNRP